MKKIIVLFILGTTLLLPSISKAAADLSTAQTYLTAHAENPWSTMALSALGASSIPSDYLKSISASSAIDYSAPILAITALNQDPRTFGDKDYVAELKKFHTNNQIGDESTINDDIFGLLALLSAGEPTSDSTITDAKNFILAHQQENGGWGFMTLGGTDSNITSAAIVALVADGISASDPVIQNALNYLKTTQNDDGGFTYDPDSPWGTGSDSSSTAWVLWALKSTGNDLADWTKSDHSPTGYLESNQIGDGYFQYQFGSGEDAFSAATTAYAVIALAGKTLPLHIFTLPQPISSGGGFITPPEIQPPVIPTTANPPVPAPEAAAGQVLGAITFAEATLVKTTDSPTVYTVMDGKFRPFSSEKIFFAYGLKFSNVQIIGSDIITAGNMGLIMNYPDGTPHE